MAVTRVNTDKASRSFVKEHWTSESKEEIMDLFEQVERCYPEQGYGTRLYDIRQDPTGLLWHAEFSRYTSCD